MNKKIKLGDRLSGQVVFSRNDGLITLAWVARKWHGSMSFLAIRTGRPQKEKSKPAPSTSATNSLFSVPPMGLSSEEWQRKYGTVSFESGRYVGDGSSHDMKLAKDREGSGQWLRITQLPFFVTRTWVELVKKMSLSGDEL